MVRVCAVKNCHEKRTYKRTDISFHKFPVNDERKSMWLKAINYTNFVPNKGSCICSKHFKKDCFIGNRLRKNACPSIINIPNIGLLKSRIQEKLITQEESTGDKTHITASCSKINTPNESMDCGISSMKREGTDVTKNFSEQSAQNNASTGNEDFRSEIPLQGHAVYFVIKKEPQFEETVEFSTNIVTTEREFFLKKTPKVEFEEEDSSDYFPRQHSVYGNSDESLSERVRAVEEEDIFRDYLRVEECDIKEELIVKEENLSDFTEDIAENENISFLLKEMKHETLRIDELNPREGKETVSRDASRIETDLKSEQEKEEVIAAEKTDDDKQYICKICQMGFSHKSTAKKHVVVHLGAKPFTWKKSHNLRNKTLIESISIQYNCKECNKIFNRRSSLNQHLAIHTGARPYICEHCHKKFRHNSSLIRHVLVHTNAKPYKCKECHKQFNQKDSLKRHMLLHSGEKPYGCEYCFKQFSDKSNLKKHLIVHMKTKPLQLQRVP